jgi:crossover junction endodeoxyribonuclease RusA
VSPGTLQVFVPGVPAPQGSVKAFANPRTGRPIIVKANDKRQKSWRGDIREQAAAVWGGAPPLVGAVRVQLGFVMPRPTSTPKKSTPAAVKRPDLDKLVRAVFDALTSAGVWNDDSQVVDVHATKVLALMGGRSGCFITVQPAAGVPAGILKASVTE